MLDRTADGDFKYMKAKDIAVRVTEEWKGLTDTEKEVCWICLSAGNHNHGSMELTEPF
jgi:hypothetical protein